jgi:hypothetical protein
VLVTHDRRTIPDFAFDRVAARLTMPGVFVVPNFPSLGEIIEELGCLAIDSAPDEWFDRVVFLPCFR